MSAATAPARTHRAAAAALLLFAVIAIPVANLVVHLIAPTPAAEVVGDDGQVRVGGRSLKAAAEALTEPRLRLVAPIPVAEAVLDRTHLPN